MAKLRKMQIIDTGTGALETEKEFEGDFCVQFTDKDNGCIKRLGRILNAKFGDKHEIKNWYYEPIAARLVEKFEELAHIDASGILFLENTHWAQPKGGVKKWTWIARIKKANEHLQNTWGYDYIMEIKMHFASDMDIEKIVALIYHELRHIGEEGELLHHDVEDWNNLVATLGVNWPSTHAEIIDLLGEEFEGFDELRTVGRQISLNGGGSAAMSERPGKA